MKHWDTVTVLESYLAFFQTKWDGTSDMFLIGGPAFSGTTLLSLLLNQGTTVCLDEPDFHNPEQGHRGIPFLQTLFPHKIFLDHRTNLGLRRYRATDRNLRADDPSTTARHQDLR